MAPTLASKSSIVLPRGYFAIALIAQHLSLDTHRLPGLPLFKQRTANATLPEYQVNTR
jgi:hypothetical protein